MSRYTRIRDGAHPYKVHKESPGLHASQNAGPEIVGGDKSVFTASTTAVVVATAVTVTVAWGTMYESWASDSDCADNFLDVH